MAGGYRTLNQANIIGDIRKGDVPMRVDVDFLGRHTGLVDLSLWALNVERLSGKTFLVTRKPPCTFLW